MSLLLTNCHLISPDQNFNGSSILIENGFVRRIYAAGDALPAADRVIDVKGAMTVPGFIDVHCHGKSGVDFCDAEDQAIEKIGVDKLKEGVTSYLPTTLTLPEDLLAKALRTAANYTAKGVKGCKLPGVHLEGPFINPKCLGAQNPDYVREPDIEMVRRLAKIYPVKKVSYAVEMPHGAEFAAELIAEGIQPSCAHSGAKYGEFLAAYEHGLHALTHFCNQMTPLHHRDIGLVGAGLMHQDVYVEMICDKLHLCPDMIKLIFSRKDINHILLITDAMRAAGMPDGESSLGGLAVIVKDGAARLASNGALAGSTLQICDALRNVYEITGLPLEQLIRTTSLNQACSLGLEKVGRIAPGYCADIVILNDRFKVQKTFVDGELRYEA
ncbi:MAG: N-acetylglucosamine-6-phosphate deacetylase [Lentisphaeria bacterium]|nr:N-acetylglucosamine-6-phosphate deacetylase [Lentisphaeria bacterium]